MKKKLILIVMLTFLTGCATTGIMPTVKAIEVVNTESESLRKLMTTFLQNWPLISGGVEGYFASHPTDVSLAMRLGRERIDQAEAKGVGEGKNRTWSQRDLGIAFGCSVDLFNRAFMDWLGRVFPQLLTLVPLVMF
jgi:hypothetical protein